MRKKNAHSLLIALYITRVLHFSAFIFTGHCFQSLPHPGSTVFSVSANWNGGAWLPNESAFIFTSN